MTTEVANGELGEARAAVARLKKAQTTLKLSNSQFVGRFRDGNGDVLLGSQRTWERMSKDEWDNNKPEKWLDKLRQACSQLDGGTPVRNVFPDMPFFKKATEILNRLEAQKTDRRIAVMLGWTGTGKSVWARAQVDKQRATRIYVRAMPGWREKGIAICSGIIQAINGERLELNMGYDEALGKLKLLLGSSDITVFLDEAHEGGVELMKIIRYLVDETTSRFVYLGYPTEYNRVVAASTGALAEARQFLGRALKPIFTDYQNGTKVEDVAVILKRNGFDAADARDVAARTTPSLVAGTGLRMLADCLELAKEWAAEDEADLSPDLIQEALEEMTGVSVKNEKKRKLEEQLKAN
jgi:hypothetical protein